ncbi:hypothetical protein LCGC14_1320810, partial [marine sediment metagenome]
VPDRKERRPFGNAEYRLSAPERKGYHRRWFNDKTGRIDRAKEAGYETVKDVAPRFVGTHEDNTKMEAVLMEIPQAWYDEDQAKKQERNNKIDRAIQEGKYENALGEHGYIPDSGIKITADTHEPGS